MRITASFLERSLGRRERRQFQQVRAILAAEGWRAERRLTENLELVYRHRDHPRAVIYQSGVLGVGGIVFPKLDRRGSGWGNHFYSLPELRRLLGGVGRKA